ncbi:MAG: hypothetical protein AAFR18_16195 [Cyanobacteria bacterium J06627_32]
MLLLGSTTMTVEGITVFPDHADPDQYWYLPGPVSLARRQADKRAAFTFIKYKPAAVSAGARGGGFLTFEVNLRLDPNLERRILSMLSAVAQGRPRLAVVPFDEGIVQCVALNLQGAGGTTASPAGEGTFNAVEQILGASVPSLHGDNSASFSLTLSQEGAIILEEAFEQGTTPVGVIYDLKFTGMRPALDVKITADFKRVYKHFSGSLSAQYYFVQAGIDAGFEKLVQDGAIKIEVTNFTGDKDLKEKEKWALDFFKDQLLSEWFKPTLKPGELAGGIAKPASLSDVLKQGNQLRPPATPAPPRPTPSTTTPTRPVATPPRPTQGSGQGNASVGVQPQPVSQPAAGESPTSGTGGLTPSAQVPPLATAGLGFTPSTAASALSTAAGSAASAPLVSFKLKFIKQEELKTLTLQYTTSEATQRSYAPQGFFGLLTTDLDRQNHFVEVDLDAPFFEVFGITLDSPIDFEQIGLDSIHVALDYGDPNNAQNHKHGDFVFEKDQKDPKDFKVFMNDTFDTAYSYQMQYHFNPQSGWEGKQFSYDYPPQRTEDRTLYLNPFEHLGFLSVDVFPDQIDAGIIQSTDVHLKYESPEGWVKERVFLVKPDSPSQFWQLRLSDREARTYTYHLVHHLEDGSTRTTEPVTQSATKLPISDPFESALNLEFIPLLDADVRLAFVDVEYSDPENSYERQERLTLQPGAFDPVKLRISLVNPDQKTFRYRLTVVKNDNSMRRDAFVETTETLIAVT